MGKRIYIGGRFVSVEQGNVVAGANAILDDTKGKKQNVINSETDAELLRLQNEKQDNLTFDNAPTENSNNPVKSGGVYAADQALQAAIEAILLLIPSAASELNKLVDTNLMNSSISTATATFRGTYNVVTDLGLTYQATHEQIAAALDALVTTADNNDYCFVQIPTSDQSSEILKTERYKHNGTNWGYEYDLNTSGFTAAQWAAINSGITALLVAKLGALPTADELTTLLGQKQDNLTFDTEPTALSNNPVTSGGVYAAILAVASALSTYQALIDPKIAAIEGKIPSGASSSNQLTAKDYVDGIQTTLQGYIDAINGKIPAAAATNNQLTDKNYVDTLIAIITANIPDSASGENKLVDTAAMMSYVAGIINAIDASFNVTSTDGHITLHITQVDGVITSVQVQGSDIASAADLALKASQADLTALASRVTTAEENITTLTNRIASDEVDIANLQQLYNNLQQSKPVPVTSLPTSGQQQGVIYRLAGSASYSDYMWNGSSWVLMATYNNAIDAEPIKGSNNLVSSDGVAKSFSDNGIYTKINVGLVTGVLMIDGIYDTGSQYGNNKISDYIPVKKGGVIKGLFASGLEGYADICFYDANDTPMAYVGSQYVESGMNYFISPIDGKARIMTNTDINPNLELYYKESNSGALSEMVLKASMNGYIYTGVYEVGLLHTDGDIYAIHWNNLTSDYIHLNAGEGVKFKGLGFSTPYADFCVYNTSKVKISALNHPVGLQTFFATEECYVRISMVREDRFIMFTKYEEIQNYSKWIGKKIGFIGDSTTVTETSTYVAKYQQKSNCVAVNYGVGGTTIADAGIANPMCLRISQLDNDLDMVVILGGVNDFRSGVPLGDFSHYNTDGSLNNTFYGALHTLARGLKEKYPSKPIVFMTPMHNCYADAQYGDTAEYNLAEFNNNGVLIENKFPLLNGTTIDDATATGGTMSQYINAIKKVCKYYAIPVIDLHAESGIEPMIASNKTLYMPDGIHPTTAAGGQRIADTIYPYLENMYQ